MDLYQLIRQDHQKVKRLFERLAESDSGSPSQTRLFAELKHELELHTEIEEKHFYPALQRHDEAKDLVEEALEEHGEAKEALEDLDRADKEDASWAEQLTELQEDVESHIEEEETEIFPVAQKVLDSAQAEAIAHDIEQDKAAAQKGAKSRPRGPGRLPAGGSGNGRGAAGHAPAKARGRRGFSSRRGASRPAADKPSVNYSQLLLSSRLRRENS